MPINLNEVQRVFVQEECRVLVEDLIKFRARLDAFVLDYVPDETNVVVAP